MVSETLYGYRQKRKMQVLKRIVVLSLFLLAARGNQANSEEAQSVGFKYRFSGGVGYEVIVANTKGIPYKNNHMIDLLARMAFRITDRLYLEIEGGGTIGIKVTPFGFHASVLLNYSFSPLPSSFSPYVFSGVGGGLLWPFNVEGGESPDGFGPFMFTFGLGMRNIINGFGTEVRTNIVPQFKEDNYAFSVVGMLTYSIDWGRVDAGE